MQIKRNKDVFGKAIKDFYEGKDAVIRTWSSIGGWDELPVAYLFRSFEEMPEIEKTALKMASGKVLDIGCGAGCHSKYLSYLGLSVKPVDLSEGAVEVCNKRGLTTAEVIDIWQVKDVKYDTILSLMNGAGICGSMDKVPGFLNHLISLLEPGGQILIDSSDLIYMYEDENGSVDLSEVKGYYGEVEFDIKYREINSGTYPWLFIDFDNLKQEANRLNLNCELLVEGPHYDYLARLTLMND